MCVYSMLLDEHACVYTACVVAVCDGGCSPAAMLPVPPTAWRHWLSSFTTTLRLWKVSWSVTLVVPLPTPLLLPPPFMISNCFCGWEVATQPCIMFMTLCILFSPLLSLAPPPLLCRPQSTPTQPHKRSLTVPVERYEIL